MYATASESFRDITVIDVDTHLTEPLDLWTSRAPAAWKDRMPQVHEVDGVPTWFIDGKPFGLAQPSSCILEDGTKLLGAGFRNLRHDQIDPGSSHVKPRLKVMDNTGIAAQIVYPNLLGFGNTKMTGLDPELQLMTTTIYNDAMGELQAESGNRLFPMMLVPWWDMESALAEIKRCHKMGLRGINTNADPQDAGLPDLGTAHWDPMWELCQDLKLPVNFHIGGSQTQNTWFGSTPWPSQGDDQKLAIGSAMMFISNARIISNLLLSGVCERFPTLQLVSVESGIGWIPALLEALDYQSLEMAPSARAQLKLKPSEYFKRQMHACFWFECDDITHAIKRIGVDNVWVLEGGLKAWREHGLPVSQSPEVPEAVAERLGVKLSAPGTLPN